MQDEHIPHALRRRNVFEGRARSALTCCTCKKPVRPRQPLAIVVKWNEILFDETEGKRISRFDVDLCDIQITVKLQPEPIVSVTITGKSKLEGHKIRLVHEPAIETYHHRTNCGFSNGIRYQVAGSYEGGKRR